MKILLVEDNKILSNNIKTYLSLKEIECIQNFSGENILHILTQYDFDLIIMDLGLGEKDGIDICSEIRKNGKNIPILILTARDSIKDKINGFNAGADDYLLKPFNYEELLLRINALIRRNFVVKGQEIEENGLNINKNTQIHLSKIEYDLLVYLLNFKGKIISKKELLLKVWGEYDDFFPSRTVDIYIGYLRKKIDSNLIQTIRGEGYMIK